MITTPEPKEQLPSTTPAPLDAPRIEFIDGMRALAALYVLIHHIWLTIWPIGYNRYPGKGPVQSLTTWLSFGHFSVTVFIVISGFCLGLPIARKGAAGWHGALGFYKRRAKRILPPYYAAMVLTVLITLLLLHSKTGTLWDVMLPFRPDKAWYSLFLLNDVYGTNQINGVFWSVAVECQIYLLFPLLVLIWLRANVWWSAATAIALGYLIAVKTQQTPYMGLTAQYLAMFALGFTPAYLYQTPVWRQRTSKFPWALSSFLLFAALAIKMHATSLGKASSKFIWFDLVIGLSAACLIMAGCHGNKRLNAFLCSKPMLWIGAFSYSLYLTHLPVIQIVWQFAIRPLNLSDWVQFCLLVVAGTASAIGAAWGFYLLVERHFDPAAKKRAAAEHLTA